MDVTDSMRLSVTRQVLFVNGNSAGGIILPAFFFDGVVING